MKFGQLLQNNMRNIFVEKSYTKCGGENIPRPFSKKITTEFISESITINQFISSLSLVFCFVQFVFIVW